MDLADAGFWFKNVLANLLLYPSGPILLAAAGVAMWRRRPRAARATVAAGLAIFYVFSVPLVANALNAFDERAFPPFDPRGPASQAAAIVVLGGGMQTGALDYGGETVNATTLTRLRSAARLHAATGLPILVSGGRAPLNRTSEADQMSDTLMRDFHVPVRWREDRSLDTADNARMSAALLAASGIGRVLLVTDVSHMRRAQALFVASGVEVTPAPTDYFGVAPIGLLSFIPQGTAIRRSAWAIHEWVGYGWVLVRRALRA